jgi:hypothetical protein
VQHSTTDTEPFADFQFTANHLYAEITLFTVAAEVTLLAVAVEITLFTITTEITLFAIAAATSFIGRRQLQLHTPIFSGATAVHFSILQQPVTATNAATSTLLKNVFIFIPDDFIKLS